MSKRTLSFGSGSSTTPGYHATNFRSYATKTCLANVSSASLYRWRGDAAMHIVGQMAKHEIEWAWACI